MKQKKSLYDRVKKVQCQHMIAREKNDLFCKLPLELDWYRMEMYDRIIEELRRNGMIEETIETTPDYKIIKMKLLIIEPEQEDPEDDLTEEEFERMGDEINQAIMNDILGNKN